MELKEKRTNVGKYSILHIVETRKQLLFIVILIDNFLIIRMEYLR